MTTKQAKKKSAPDFESNLHALETVVQQLESEHLTLEEAFFQFERGMGLVQTCQNSLTALQNRVQMLIEKQGKPTFTDFEEPDDAL